MSFRPLSIVALVAVALQGAPTLAADGRIHVLGRAIVEVVPDHATISVGVETRAGTATGALDSNSAAIRKVLDFARNAGVDAKDLRTSSVSLFPNTKQVRDPAGGYRQEPDGYRASNTVQVRLKDLGGLGRFMRDVVDQGANRVNGVSFGLTDPDRVADEARAAAVQDAVRRAERLADAAKVKLGPILQIASPPRIELRPTPDGEADLPARKAMSAVPIEVGTIQVSAEVDITWSLQ